MQKIYKKITRTIIFVLSVISAPYQIQAAYGVNIIYASFGNHNASGQTQKANVSSIVRNSYAQYGASFSITSGGLNGTASYGGLFGDPAPGVFKSLIVFYQYPNNPNIYVQSTNTNQAFQFPSSNTGFTVSATAPNSSWPGFALPIVPNTSSPTILGAWYGDMQQANLATAQTGSSPVRLVTSTVTSMLQGIATGTPGSPFGPDPAPNIIKGLVALYEQNGYMYFQCLTDGDPITNISSTSTNAYHVDYYNGAIDGSTNGYSDVINGNAKSLPNSNASQEYTTGYQFAYPIGSTRGTGYIAGNNAGANSTALSPLTSNSSDPVYAGGYNAGAADAFAIITNYTAPAGNDGIYPVWRPTWVLLTPGVGSVSFNAVAANDITVVISPTSQNGSQTTNRGPAYEIVLGGWGNKASCIRKNPQGSVILAGGDPSSPVGNTNWNTARIITNNAGSPALITINVDQYKRTTDQQNIVKITVYGAVDANNNPVTLTYEDTNPILNTYYFSLTSWDTQIVYSNITTTALSPTAIDTDRGTTDGTYDTIAGVAPANGVITTGSATYNQYYLAGYNTVFSDANNAITAAINDAKANNTAATSAPSTASNPTIYMTAYTKAYNDYKSGNTAGNSYGSTDANANPPVTTAHDTLTTSQATTQTTTAPTTTTTTTRAPATTTTTIPAGTGMM